MKLQKKIRIALTLKILGTMGILFSLILASKNSDYLIPTAFLTILLMLETHEKKKIRSIIEWSLSLAYVTFLMYIVIKKSFNFAVLIVATLIMMHILLKRLRNEWIEEDWI